MVVKCPSCGEDNPAKFRLCGYCGTALSAAPPPPVRHDVRKTVTIVFCDLVGSTALGERLDNEALHELEERYFEAMSEPIVRHGGKVEKYIGDAIMAVFGVPRAHEDDALRAVRAAAGMQAALETLNEELEALYGIRLANRTGVNTGEVLANDDPAANQRLAIGDAVNVAARLEQAAPACGIYIGEVTHRLVRDAVDAEPLAPLELEGKAQAVAAWRLIAVRGDAGIARRHDQPVVGRDAELARLQRAYADAVEQRAVRMLTLVGDAGVGKTRLVHEAIDRIALGARVLAARCLPYGDGITFWPLRAMVLGAAGVGDDEAPDVALRAVHAALGDDAVATRLASAIGLGKGSFPLAETYWAVRRFFEQRAADGPLLVFVDDIHWAGSAFLDLLEHVVATTRGAPILLLATARHELLEERPDWGTQPPAQRIVLEPLPDDAAARVIANRLGGAELPQDVVHRVIDAAEGNPLYVEQMLSMLIDNGALREQAGRWIATAPGLEIAVPPSIQALLEARLDALAASERATVEPAAVIGLEFPQPAVQSIAPSALREQVPQKLDALARKHFIRTVGAGEGPQSRVVDGSATGLAADHYRFQHHLVRDTVYHGLLKRVRAQLHLDFVRWADAVHGERAPEFEEILGYHLEQAHRNLAELGALDDTGLGAAADGARRLSAAGRRAAARGDMHAAENLLRRAVALLTPADPMRLALLPELAETRIGLADFAGAKPLLDEALAQATQAGNRRVAAASRLGMLLVGLYSGEQPDWSAQALDIAQEQIAVLEPEAAHGELATVWRIVGMVHATAGRYSPATEAVGRAVAHARSAGNERMVARSGLGLASLALVGTTPVSDAIEQCRRLLDDGLPDRQIESNVRCVLAQLLAMAGDVDSARAICMDSRAVLRDLGQGVYAASTGIELARIALLGGERACAEAEVEVRADHDFLAAKGETYYLSTIAALLARLVREQGRDDEALELTRSAEAASAADDIESQALWRMVRAPILARRRCGSWPGARARGDRDAATDRGADAEGRCAGRTRERARERGPARGVARDARRSRGDLSRQGQPRDDRTLRSARAHLTAPQKIFTDPLRVLISVHSKSPSSSSGNSVPLREFFEYALRAAMHGMPSVRGVVGLAHAPMIKPS